MLKKLNLNKNTVLTVLTLFAVVTVKLMYEFSRLGRLLPKYIVLNLAGAVALTAFLSICLVPAVSKAKIDGQGVFGFAALIYLLAFNIDEFIIRIDVLVFFITISIMLLLVRKIWGLLIVAAAGAVMSHFLWHAAVDSLPAVMTVSMIAFAPMFRKAKPVSKKKAKKAVPAEPQPDNKKEKIIFIVSELIMAASFVYAAYIHKHFITAFQFECNFRYYIFPAVLAIALVAVAAVAAIRKRGFLEIAAYLVPALCFVTAAVSEYTMAVDYGASLLFVCFMICREDCVFAELVQKAVDAVVSKIPQKAKAE